MSFFAKRGEYRVYNRIFFNNYSRNGVITENNCYYMKKLKILVFADPVCTWCWGSVPVLRALEYRLGEYVEIEYVMCGMIEDIRTFSNRRLEIGGDIPLSNRNMMKAWIEASSIHGMPVMEHGMHLFSEEHPSTFPQNLAYIPAKLCCGHSDKAECDIKRANRYLRRVQEATAVEGLLTTHNEVLADLAAVEGFNPEEFARTLESDAAKKAFMADRARAREYDVKSFPTFIIEYDGREKMLSGYTAYSAFAAEISALAGGKIKSMLTDKIDSTHHCAPSIKNVKAFVDHYGSAYPVEIATAFSLVRRSGRSAVNIESYELFPDIVDELLKNGDIGMHPTANSFKIFSLVGKEGVSMEREKELHHYW